MNKGVYNWWHTYAHCMPTGMCTDSLHMLSMHSALLVQFLLTCAVCSVLKCGHSAVRPHMQTLPSEPSVQGPSTPVQCALVHWYEEVPHAGPPKARGCKLLKWECMPRSALETGVCCTCIQGVAGPHSHFYLNVFKWDRLVADKAYL